MAFGKAVESYSLTQKRLHWAVVLLLAAQFMLFDDMGGPYQQLINTGIASYGLVVVAHSVIGVALLGLVAWRVLLRIRHGAPRPPEGEPELFRWAALAGHMALYGLLLILPINGLAAWYGEAEAAGALHGVLCNILVVMIFLHVGAVIVHETWWKTGVMSRMN